MCKVSIIMTSYNKPKYIGKAIEGVLNQTFKDFELLLMDDNSDEETRNIIQGYLKDKRIRYYCSDVTSVEERTEKVRYAVLINKALDMIKGQYVSYATDDNVYRPERLEKMVDFMDRHPEVKIAYSSSKVQYLDKDGVFVRSIEREAKAETWLAPCMVDHCSIMHRTDILPVIFDKWGSYWDEDPQFYFLGDARFFWRLNHFWPFHPIHEILDDNYMTEISLHTHMNSEEHPLIKLLPEQRICKEIRDYLRCLRKENLEKEERRLKEEQSQKEKSNYLENYWLLFLDFIDLFHELIFEKIPLPLLSNFYQYIDTDLREEMKKTSFKEHLTRKKITLNEIQPQFECWLHSFKQPAACRLLDSSKCKPMKGKILLNLEYLRFSHNSFKVYDPEETIIFTQFKRKLGIPVHCIQDYKVEVQDSIDKLVKRAESIFSPIQKHYVLQNDFFSHSFLNNIPKMVETIAAVRKYFQDNLISCVVVGTTEDLTSRILTMVAGEKGIPSICLQHGILGGEEAYLPVFATVEAVYGQYEKDWYRERGVSEEYIAITGHPRFDDIFDQNHMPKETFIMKYGLDAGKKHVLVATQHICSSLCREFIDIAATIPGIEIIIKPHPWELNHGNYIEEYKNLENKYKSVKLIAERGVNLYDLLSNTDVVIINASTVGLEAVLANKPLCILYEGSFKYYDRMGDFKFSNPAKLAEFIPRLLKDEELQEKSKAVNQEFLAYAYPQRLAGGCLIEEINRIIGRK